MHEELYWMFEGGPLTIKRTGRPQANEPPRHEPRRTRWSRRPSRSWWPLWRLRCSSHARRLWWSPWWLPSQRWRLPWWLPWRSWCPRRLQPLLSDAPREQQSTQRALRSRCLQAACGKSSYEAKIPMAGRQRQGPPRVCSEERGYETRRCACFHYYHSCVCYSFLRDEKDKTGTERVYQKEATRNYCHVKGGARAIP
jgi:hypothetical protein